MSRLKNHPILSSKNLHEMRELLSTLANTAEIDVVGKGREIDGAVHSVSFSDLTLSHVTYGPVSTVIKEREADADVLLMVMVTDGTATVQHRGRQFDVSPDIGLMRDVSVPLTASQDQIACYGLPFSTRALKKHAHALIGDTTDLTELQFDIRLDLTKPNERYVRDTMHYVANALDGPLRNLDSPIALSGLRDLLFTSVLTFLPNSYSERMHQQPTSAAVPYYVKRARDYIHAYAHTDITLESLANKAGCSYRTLQVAFMDAFGLTPIAYVRSVRLTYVHNDLLAAGEDITVFDVAVKWGFTHMGRFAQSYQKQYGVLPSHTLRSRM